MRLFEIDAQIEALLNASVDMETGEINEAALAELEALEAQRDEKALAVAAYIVGQEAEAEAVRAQRLEEAGWAAVNTLTAVAQHFDALRAALEEE